jgi:hypothetical protein
MQKPPVAGAGKRHGGFRLGEEGYGMTRTCAWCGKPFQAKRSHAKTCSEVCRGRMNTRKRRLAANGATDANASPEAPAPMPLEPTGSDGVQEMVAETLQHANRYDAPHGQIAVVLARRLDSAHTETAVGITALSRELERILEKALAGVQVKPDELDELEKRRREKAARANR